MEDDAAIGGVLTFSLQVGELDVDLSAWKAGLVTAAGCLAA